VDYSTLQIFGCLEYSLVDSQKRNKLEAKSRKYRFIGFTIGVKGFRLWDPETRSAFNSRDVVFDEESMLQGSKTDVKSQDGAPVSSADSQTESVEFSEISDTSVENSETGGDIDEATQEQPRPLRRSSRISVPPTRYGWSDEHVSFALVTEAGDPACYRDAIEADDHDKWVTAMEQEMESLERNETWSLVDLPKGSKAIGCKWVFRKKDKEQYKARLVAKGFAQKEGVDYNEIFSPVVKHTSIRLLLAIVAQFDLELEQMDVRTAFLHGELEQ